MNLINCGYKIDGITSLQYKSKIKKKRIKELNKKKIKIYKKNLLDKKSFLNLKKYEIIINAIGWTSNYNNKKFDNKKIYKNYKIFFNNLEKYLHKNKPKLFIEIGSSAEYGKSEKKLRENMNSFPDTPYGLLKAKNTLFLKKLSEKSKIPIIVLRVFSIFGYLDKESKLIEYIKNKNEIIINNPKLKQDFISVSYLNKIIINILKKKKYKKFDIYNCCSATEINPIQIINLLPKKIFQEKNIKFNLNNKKNYISNKKIYIGNNKKILNNLKIKKINIFKEIKKYLSH